MSADAVSIASAIAERRLSAREVVRAALDAAQADALGCFWTLDGDRALTRADMLDRSLARGEPAGALAGVPFGVKDCFDLAGQPSWCGVRWERPPPPAPTSAAAVEALEHSGAVALGKTSMHQLAWGMSGAAPGFPACRNPHDPERMPGGSSGGSAAAVAAQIVPLALGTDTGGSVRQPAAWCGVVGFKPSLGTLSLAGCAPLSRSLDTAGLLTRSLRDCRRAFSILTGAHAAEPGGRRDEPAGRHGGNLRLGIVGDLFEDCGPGVAERCEEALSGLGESRAVTLPAVRKLLGPLYAAELADAWGERADAQTDGLLDDLRASVDAGRQVLAVDYLGALRALQVLRRQAAQAVEAVDVVACPTSPLLPPPLTSPDPTRRAGRNTRVFNALGWPSISLPCGEVDGLPVGLMLSAPPGRDLDLLDAAERLAGSSPAA